MIREGIILDGKYEILKKIGEGGMSVVYLARNNRLNMQLAVKEIKNDGSKKTEVLLKGLEREANILKDVDHPVIPRIIDIVKYSGTICVVMDYIEGEDMLDYIRENGAVAQDLVVKWALQLADALKYLHSMKPPIIYRDMKPGNVMIKPGGEDVKLIDFGTAKEYTIENNADTTALGTRGYAAPEQFGDEKGRGKYKTDARTDIYNLGATMYHMATGRSPQEPPYEMVPIRQVNPALSTGLEKIILKCTRPNPNERYQNCSELIYALQHYNELDESYMHENRNKTAVFAGAAICTLIFTGVAIGGRVGMNHVEQNNYYSNIEAGDKARAARNYDEAAKQYQAAFELKKGESEAYVKYIDLYIAEANDLKSNENSEKTDEDNSPEEILQGGLNTVAGSLNRGDISASKNEDVIYRLGLTYFQELSDYPTANQYFAMIDSKEGKNAEYARYYGSIAEILSNPSPDISKLMDDVNNFAGQTINTADNNTEKFENYNTLGDIYVRYLNEKSIDGIPDQAEKVMTQAEDDLSNYSGDDSSDFDLAFSDDLSEIYYKLGQDKSSVDYYKESISSSEKVQSLAQAKLKEAGVSITDTNANESAKGYIQKYVDKVNRIAEIYGNMSKMKGNKNADNDFNSALKTYKKAETEFGTSANAAEIYVEHLNFLYGSYEQKYGNDPAAWPDSATATIVNVYKSGKKVAGIGNNHNWATRISIMDKLEDGSLAAEEADEKAADADIKQDEASSGDADKENTSGSSDDSGKGE